MIKVNLRRSHRRHLLERHLEPRGEAPRVGVAAEDVPLRATSQCHQAARGVFTAGELK